MGCVTAGSFCIKQLPRSGEGLGSEAGAGIGHTQDEILFLFCNQQCDSAATGETFSSHTLVSELAETARALCAPAGVQLILNEQWQGTLCAAQCDLLRAAENLLDSGVFKSCVSAAICSARCCSIRHWLCRLSVSSRPIVCIACSVAENSRRCAPSASMRSGCCACQFENKLKNDKRFTICY